MFAYRGRLFGPIQGYVRRSWKASMEVDVALEAVEAISENGRCIGLAACIVTEAYMLAFIADD